MVRGLAAESCVTKEPDAGASVPAAGWAGETSGVTKFGVFPFF